MGFFDILRLALRNLREAKLRAALTTTGVIIGVAVIVTMVSFGLGLQRNTVARFKELDLFNEITVYGRTLSSIVSRRLERERPGGRRDGPPENPNQPRARERSSERSLDDAAIAEIAGIPGVESVEPNIQFTVYVRANNRTAMQTVSGALVPNRASRFKEFAAGGMISAPDADEAVVDQSCISELGYEQAADAIGQTLEFLAPPDTRREADEQLSFFGIPLEDTGSHQTSAGSLGERSFRIVGVLKDELSGRGAGGRRFRGMMPAAGVYIPLPAARDWSTRHRSALNEVALRLARESRAIGENETEGYPSAVVRVTSPAVLADVKKRLADMNFNSFSIVDQLDEISRVFLIINSALGLLGGISLLVAAFGIANTMIMSILERTREIGIMKAIGAEDREIKLIFFLEAAVIGFTGGVAGTVAAWIIDAGANRLAYQFLLKPQGASFVDFFAIPIYLWAGAILFAVLISIVAALYPASRAARIDPVKALRHD
jgi:ABC-type antimicrobial peptide transport system permease subunit